MCRGPLWPRQALKYESCLPGDLALLMSLSLSFFFINNNKSNTCLCVGKNWMVQIANNKRIFPVLPADSGARIYDDLSTFGRQLLPLLEWKAEWTSTRELAKVTNVLLVTKFNAHFTILQGVRDIISHTLLEFPSLTFTISWTAHLLISVPWRFPQASLLSPSKWLCLPGFKIPLTTWPVNCFWFCLYFSTVQLAIPFSNPDPSPSLDNSLSGPPNPTPT